MQVPSIYSAIKVNGERAYKLAREGKEVELKARPVTIYDLTIREIAPPVIKLHVTCSSGTYIRALGRDIGEKAGCLLTMSSLVRTVVGPFSIENAKTMEENRKGSGRIPHDESETDPFRPSQYRAFRKGSQGFPSGETAQDEKKRP